MKTIRRHSQHAQKMVVRALILIGPVIVLNLYWIIRTGIQPLSFPTHETKYLASQQQCFMKTAHCIGKISKVNPCMDQHGPQMHGLL